MKDLLVHVDDTAASPPRLGAALALAEAFGARLTALCLVAEPYMPAAAARRLPAEALREHVARAEAEAEAVLAAAREAAAGRGLTLEARREFGPLSRVPHLLARHARHADLAIVGQADAATGGADEAALAEAAFMDSGCPALVVPPAGPGTDLPAREVLLAWDGSREAARAAGDALPLLRLAEHVTVLIVDGRDASGHPPGAEIAAHLARHGVKAEVREAASDDASVGETILAQARDVGAGLLVMGGYGHSRLRETILGGVTRHVLDHATLPVMLSH